MLKKDILGVDFGDEKQNIVVSKERCALLVTTLKGCISASRDVHCGVSFDEFRSTMEKVRDAFTSIPTRRGLLSSYNKLLREEPRFVFLNGNKKLLSAIRDCRTMLVEVLAAPTRYRELVSGKPLFGGFKDASSHCVGGDDFLGKASCVLL